MKKILLLLFMGALMPMAAGAQTPTDDTFTVSDLVWSADDECYIFSVGLNGSQIYSAYNLTITLPAGISVKYEVDDEGTKSYFVYLSEDPSFYPYTGSESRKKFKHDVSGVVVDGNQLNVACISLENATFKTTSGDLFDVLVDVDESAFTSSFSPKPIVKFSGLNLTTATAVKYVPADFACRPFTTGIPTDRTLPVNISAQNKIGTLILPFDAALPDGLKAYTCDAADGDLLTLIPATSIEACKPYIVYAENGYSGNLSGTATLPTDFADNVTDLFADGILTGVLTATTVNSGYILQNQGSGPLFYDAEGVTFSLPAGRCYLTPTASGNVKAFTFNFGNETGVKTTLNSQLSTFNLFDLSGRKVEAPARGIYIQGTRKVFVK